MEQKHANIAAVTAANLTAFCIATMQKSGLSDKDARLTAEVLVTTDTLGTFTHGIADFGKSVLHRRETGGKAGGDGCDRNAASLQCANG